MCVWGGGGGVKHSLSLWRKCRCEQLRFLGVGRRHLSASLQYEITILPLKWKAIKRVVDFWVQVMRMNDDRLANVVMLEALELEVR